MADNKFVLGVGVEVDANQTKIQSQLNNKIKDAKIKAALEINATSGNFQKEISRLKSTISENLKLDIDNKTATQAIKNTQKAYSELRKEVYQGLGAKSPELASMSKYYTNLEKNIVAQNKFNESMGIVGNRADGASQSFQSYLKTLKPQAIKAYSSEIKDLSNSFSQASESGKQIDLSKANSHLSKFKSEMKNAGMETASLTTVLKDNITAFTNWYFIGNAVSSVVRSFKSAISTIVETDTLLTEISKTSNLVGKDLEKLGISAYDAASRYGVTVQGYLKGFQELSRGYDTGQAASLTEMSILAQAAGNMTAELANEYVIATNAAFKLNGEVSKINAVLDSQNQVSNRNQVSMEKLAQATKVAGSQSASAGVQVNEMTAAVATMGVVTQEEGENLGRAWKAILMNIQQVKGTTEDGEIIDADSLSKSEKAADALGVSLKEVRNGVLSLRDPMEIIKDLAKAYLSLEDGDVRGANLISSIGGKLRGNQLSALLNNYEMYEKILGDYENASGSAASEAEKTAKSIEGRLNTLTNTWNRTVDNVVDSDILKAFISIGTGAIDLTDKMDLLQTALIALSIVGTFKAGSGLISWLTNATSSAISFGNALNIVGSKDFISNTSNLSNAIQGLTLSQATAVLSTKSLDAATIQASMAQAGFSIEEAKNTASTLAMASAQTVATGTTAGLGASFKALTTAIMANPIGLILTTLTIGISAISLATNKYKQSQEETRQSSVESTNTFKEQRIALDEQIASYEKLQKQLDESNLSIEESSSIKDQLLSIQNSLVDSYGIEASKLDLVNGKYKEQIGLLGELSKDKAYEYIATNKKGYESSNKYLSNKNTYSLNGENGGKISKEMSDYLSNYGNGISSESVSRGLLGEYTKISIDDATVEEATKKLNQLYADISDKFGNSPEAEKIKESISGWLTSFDTSKIAEARSAVDEYTKAQVVANDTLRPLFKESADAVANYNSALASGDTAKIESAKKAIDGVKESVYSQTDAVEGSRNVFDDLFKSIADSSSTVSAISNVVASLFDISIYKDQIDGLQSSLSSLQSAQEKLAKGNLSSSEVLDLLQEFPQLIPYVDMAADGFGDLSKGLTEVANIRTDGLVNDLTSIRDTLSDADKVALDTAINALKQMGDEVTNTSSGVLFLSDALSALVSNAKLVDTIKEEVKEFGYITSSTLSDITSKYPVLEAVVTDYLAGLASTEDVLAGLKTAYDTDFNNYRNTVIEKKKLDVDFYSTVVKNLSDDVKEKAKSYDIDFDNYKNLSEAKLAMEKELSQKILSLQRAQSVSSAATQQASLTGSGADISLAFKLRGMQDSANKELEDFQKIIDGMNTSLTGSLNLNDYKGLSGENTGKDKDKFSQKLDWFAIRIDKLKEKAQAAIDSIAKYTSYKTKNSRIEIAVQTKVDQAESLKSIQDSYNSAAEKIKLPQKYKDLVNNGGMDIQTITNENLAKQIDEYTKLRDAANTVGKSISAINDEIKELNQQKLDNIKSYFDMANSYTDSKVSKRESLISLKEAQGRTATKSDYNYLIKLQNDIITNNKKERDAYESLFNNQVKDGIIKKGSQEYYEGLSYLNELTIASREAQSSLIDLSNEKIKLTFKPFDTKMEKSNKIISEVDQATGFVDDNSIEQIALFQTGYAKATQNVKDLNAEIKKLNKQYAGNTSDPIYKERLADLESQLSSNANAMQSYEQSIISSMKARYDKQIDLSDKALKEELKNIEKAKKAQLDSLKKQLDEFKKYIDTRKKELRDNQETDDFDDSVAQYNKDISKLESRIGILKKAELQGDNVAREERISATEELDKLKKELDKLQKDRSVDLAEDALDKEYDAYEEKMDKQISDVESFYDLQVTQAQSLHDNKVLQLETLYENERQLIIEAAQLTQDKFTEVFASINSTMSNYGLSASSDLTSALYKGSAYANNTSKSSSISSILGAQSEANKYNQNTLNMSELNGYLASRGYKMITTKQMIELAKSLGLNDINSTKLVGTDDIGKVNKNRIMQALMKSGFKEGGIATTGSNDMLSGLLHKTGEDGYILARNGEGFIEPSAVPAVKEFVNFAPRLNDIFNGLDVNSLPNVITNNSNKPIVNINLPANTTITKDAMSEFRKFKTEITEEISKNLIIGSKR